MTHMENWWWHHGYHVSHGVDPMAAPRAAARAPLLIALLADAFAVEELWDVGDIVYGKAMVLDVVTAGVDHIRAIL